MGPFLSDGGSQSRSAVRSHIEQISSAICTQVHTAGRVVVGKQGNGKHAVDPFGETSDDVVYLISDLEARTPDRLRR
jgi:hypothetical protein